MTTILITFLITLILSLVLTPLAKKMGIKLGAIDIPNDRKMHSNPIPRTGGVAIFVSAMVSVSIAGFLGSDISDLIILDREMLFLLAGAGVVFGIGLFDDFYRLGPRVKFLFQIIGATLAFFGGIHISGLSFFGINIQLGLFNYGVTVFWFLLFINAVNLVDGLDGLAAGIVVFTSLMMMTLSILNEDFVIALYFAILSGSVLGFLRYNFNPASIFLGDGGSYFLGYAIAGLSIVGSVKTQVGAAILIPIIAMGVPIFDTMLSPLRRFVRGRKMFRPDSGHIHHRLVGLGMTAQKAVLIIYFITLFLCIAAVIATNLRNEQAGLFLIILGVGAVFIVRKLGYFEYLASDKFYGWFKDMTDQTGLSHERRTFLNYQIEISKSETIEQMWDKVSRTSEFLEMDYIEMKLLESETAPGSPNGQCFPSCEFSHGDFDPALMDWNRVMHIILPLSTKKYEFGSMSLSKNLIGFPLTPFTLRRVEQLRRTVIETLVKINRREKENNASRKGVKPAKKGL